MSPIKYIYFCSYISMEKSSLLVKVLFSPSEVKMCPPSRSLIGSVGEKASEEYSPYWLFLPPGGWRGRDSGREERKDGVGQGWGRRKWP